MARKICRINGGEFEFEFDFFGERASYNETRDIYEPILRFQTNLVEENNFVFNLMPLMGKKITSLELYNPETGDTVKMSPVYDMSLDVSTDFPQFDIQYYRGHAVFGSSQYSIELTRQLVNEENEASAENRAAAAQEAQAAAGLE